MDAIVLVGGKGTRLWPLTATRHKSLVPVGSRPAFSFLIDWMRHSGFDRAILALGQHNADLAAAFPAGDYGGLAVEVVTETDRLESGGAIRNAVASANVRGRFAVINGDVLVDFAFRKALRAHVDLNAELTIALHAVADASPFGVAEVDERSFLTAFREKSGDLRPGLVNAGVWIFEPQLVGQIPPGAVRVEETLFPDLVKERRPVLGYRGEGFWIDYGTPARYRELVLALIDRGESAVSPDLDLGGESRVTRSSIGAACVIGNGAEVRDSVLWERVIVGAGAAIRASVIAESATIGPGARLEGCVVGPGARIPPGATVPTGAVVEPGAAFGGLDG